MDAGKLGPVFVIMNVLRAVVPPVPALNNEAVFLIADWPAGVVDVLLAPAFAREKVLLMLDCAADVAGVPVFDNESVLAMAVWPLAVAVFIVSATAALLRTDDTLVRAPAAVPTVPLTSSAAPMFPVWLLVE